MNERIDKLIEECTDRHFSECVGGFETFDKEKFAELIVKECINILPEKVKVDDLHDANILVKCGWAIKQHFGVEE